MSRLHLVASLFTLSLALAATAQDPSATDAKADVKQVRRAANAAVESGDYAAAAEGFRKLTVLQPKDAQAWHMLGYSLHAGGKLDEALPAHLEATKFPATAGPASYNVACVHALQGRADEAFAWLEKAIERGFDDGELLAKDTDLVALRNDPRFAKLTETLKESAGARMMAFAQTTERRSSRVAWFGASGSPGQISLDYAPVAWNDEYEAALAAGKLEGRKWRLGADFWTTLDNSMPLVLGDVEVPAGYWYLTLAQSDAGSFVLGLHDAAEVKKQKLDPVFADRLKGGIEVPLSHATAGEKAGELEIRIAPVGRSRTQGSLAIRYGGHELSAPVVMKVE